MPTIYAERGFRFYFYPNEGNEPPHIHVQYQAATAKLWLNPIAVACVYGMKPKDLKVAAEITRKQERLFLEKWNGSLAQNLDYDFRATEIEFEDDSMIVSLSDGRKITVPIEFYPRLKKATPGQRKNYQIIGMGTGIHWPDIDEDLSTKGIVLGIPARF